MKVAIDVTSAVTQRAGVARYTRELYVALMRLNNPPDLFPFAMCRDLAGPGANGISPNLMEGSVRGWRLRMAARHVVKVPFAGPWDVANVYHATDMVYFPTRRTPVVATIHDLTFELFPHYHTRLNGGYLRLAVPMMARSANVIIADSKSTQKDVIERLRVPADRVRVVYPGLSSLFTAQPTDDAVAEVRTRFSLPNSYVLCVGTIEPRKNLAGAVSAYHLLRQRGRDLPPLVLVGATGWNPGQLGLSTADMLDGVVRLGYVTDDELVALFRGCSAFVYPSYYEGFGFPVLEALASGAPVVTSDVSSLPEVAGDAAILIDPTSIEAMADGLERVLFDTGEAARLRAAGPKRARLFDYDRCAMQVVDAYREVAGT